MSGLIAGSIAGVVYPLSIYGLAYGCMEWVRQYPFEHESMMHSGFTDVRAWLVSARGRSTVFETTVGLIPIVVVWAALQGGLLAALAGMGARWLRRRFAERYV